MILLILCIPLRYVNLILNFSIGFYDVKGVYHYFANVLSDMFVPMLIGLSYLLMYIIFRLILKDKFCEFRISRGDVMHSPFWEKGKKVIGCVTIITLIVIGVMKGPHIHLYDSVLRIYHQDEYMVQGDLETKTYVRQKSRITYSYDDLARIYIIKRGSSQEIEFKLKDEAHILFFLGRQTSSQKEFLRLLDEKTNYQFYLQETAQTE